MQIGTVRIHSIVNSLRNFSRLDESDQKVADLHEGLEGTLLILQSRLKTQAHRDAIDVIKDYGQLPKITCYPSQLNQVFLHLIGNAVDAIESVSNSDQQPRILVRTRFEQANQAAAEQDSIRQAIGPAKIIISITDNGPGIPEEIRQKIFDPFFTTKPVGQGTGLGLSISYAIIVKRHDGLLECRSEPGKGTEFIITIPIQAVPSLFEV